MTALQIQDLYLTRDEFALANINLVLPKGTIMGLIGENGAGKTTLLKAILNLIPLQDGTITLVGHDHKNEEVAAKQHIGIVFDDLFFPPYYKAKHIEGVLQRTFSTFDKYYFYGLLEQLEVPTHKKITQLSRGMRMKLALASALAHRPTLLLLDEPTSGLDPIIRDEVLTLLVTYMDEDAERSILFSSHITSDLEKIADTITFLHKGNIHFSTAKDELQYQYGLFQGDEETLNMLPPYAIVGTRKTAVGIEALVKREEVNEVFHLAQPTIEEIMLYFVKVERL